MAILGGLIVLAARFDRVENRQLRGAAAINDGDTLTLGAERIRLRGMDAPEFSQICRKAGENYPCGRNSREALMRLVGDGPVSCAGWQRDRYGRLLGDCTAGGKDLGRSQVQAGWAVAYGDYHAEEDIARKNRAGLWAGDFDRPRDWRDAHGALAEDEHDMVGKILDWLREIFSV